MSFLRKNNNAFTGDGYYDTDPVSAPESEADAPAPAPARVGSGAIELKVVSPTQFEEVAGIADHLLSGCTVFLNVENAPKETIRRIIDFLSGVAYSIGGRIKKVTASTYLITPSNVDVSEAVPYSQEQG